MTDIDAGQGAARPAVAAPSRGACLHSPLLDFLCLGGGSIPLLVAAVLLVGEAHQASVLVTASMLAVFVNNPHFMASYQIFYDRFPDKLGDRGSGLRARYWIAGVLVPAVLAGYFAWAMIAAQPAMLGRAVNVMLFLVGWHYVKQGYGILIVESVLHRAFFSETEKKILRWNGLATWIFSWVYGNRVAETGDFRGMQFISLSIPAEAVWIAGAVALATGAAALVVLGRRAARGTLPLNGACGYVAAIYPWMVLVHFDPMFLLLGPAFHSLQYLAVVWRYQLNKSAAEHASGGGDGNGDGGGDGGGDGQVELLGGRLRVSGAQARLLRFAFVGLIAGALAFSVVPALLDLAIAWREELFGPSMFLFMFVVFINIHHYFMDNVMWRKENPDIRANLFR